MERLWHECRGDGAAAQPNRPEPRASSKPKRKPAANPNLDQVLLHNLLVLDREGVGSALCAPPLDALPQLVATLEAAAQLHPSR